MIGGQRTNGGIPIPAVVMPHEQAYHKHLLQHPVLMPLEDSYPSTKEQNPTVWCRTNFVMQNAALASVLTRSKMILQRAQAMQVQSPRSGRISR